MRCVSQVELTPGDWLEHEAFRWRDRTAEVVEVREKGVLVYYKDEPGEELIAHAMITRWWSKKSAPDGPVPPPFVKKGARFYYRVGDQLLASQRPLIPTRAVIHSLRPGWVGYHETSADFENVYRIESVESFDKHWQRAEPISAWERIQTGWV
jgi:hypothetical protein